MEFATVVPSYRPECDLCQWVGKRTSDIRFACRQAERHDEDKHWTCPYGHVECTSREAHDLAELAIALQDV